MRLHQLCQLQVLSNMTQLTVQEGSSSSPPIVHIYQIGCLYRYPCQAASEASAVRLGLGWPIVTGHLFWRPVQVSCNSIQDGTTANSETNQQPSANPMLHPRQSGNGTTEGNMSRASFTALKVVAVAYPQ